VTPVPRVTVALFGYRFRISQSSAASMQLLYSITKYHMYSKQLWAGHAISFLWLDGIKGL